MITILKDIDKMSGECGQIRLPSVCIPLVVLLESLYFHPSEEM